MKKKYNIALVPKSCGEEVVKISQQLSGIADKYQLGDKSLPHVTLCQFEAEEKEIDTVAKSHEALKIKEGLLGNKLLLPADVSQLADLPAKPVLLAQLLATFNGPARSFVTVLAAVPRGLVTVLSAIEKKKSEGGAATTETKTPE